jgi:hypothetical protein
MSAALFPRPVRLLMLIRMFSSAAEGKGMKQYFKMPFVLGVFRSKKGFHEPRKWGIERKWLFGAKWRKCDKISQILF